MYYTVAGLEAAAQEVVFVLAVMENMWMWL